MYTPEEIRQAVESCGYTLVEIDTIIMGKTVRRQVPQLHVRCPAGHDYEVLQSNFMPVVDDKPKRGCGRCAEYARVTVNTEHHSERIKAKARTFDLEMLGPFTGQYDKNDWRCLKCGHIFTTSWNTVSIRKNKKCLNC